MMKSHKLKTTKAVGLFCLLPMLLQGCIVWVDDPKDLAHFTRETKAQPSGRIDPLPEYKPYQSFIYEGASLREPFNPLRNEQVREEAEVVLPKGQQLKPNLDRAKDLLEEFAIEDLLMVGSIKLGGKEWALIRDTNGAIHRVTLGDHMGLDYGEVVGLDSHGIEIEEIISDGRGGWIKRPRYVELQQAGLNGAKK